MVADADLSGSFVIAGVRTRDQLDALKEKFPDIVVIWIERDNHHPSSRDNLALSRLDANVEIRNNGIDLEEYRISIYRTLKVGHS